ncbi:hypothetical protein HBA92_06820 [Ochrobactrum sp. MR28]|nr:hypothetical protein [Ochrobactrum sp. MR28]MBX8816217.1 hypothetical protein [Ochrobactrum sp. MR31]
MDRGFYHPEFGYWQEIGQMEDEPDRPNGTIETPLKPGEDYNWVNDAWVYVPPTPLTPKEMREQMPPLTPRQFRNALVDADILTDAAPDEVTQAIAQIAEVKTRVKALNAWEYPTEFTRSDPLIDQIGAMFSLTPEQIDTMWQQALND